MAGLSASQICNRKSAIDVVPLPRLFGQHGSFFLDIGGGIDIVANRSIVLVVRLVKGF